jgi:hypothetical protein
MENISKKNLKTGIINQDIIQIFMNDIGPFNIMGKRSISY